MPGKYIPPPSKLKGKAKKTLDKVYSSCRKSQEKEGDIENPKKKEYCARVAWSVTKKKYNIK